MIIRENGDYFVMIEQDHHAHLSSDLFQQLNKNILLSKTYSLNQAISNHDYGWIPFDKTPIWNDQESRPYSFTDFPVTYKTVLYRYGIDYVEKTDMYVALLCSLHYCHFLQKSNHPLVREFLNEEKIRQEKIIASLPEFDEEKSEQHLSILQFFDSLSLYICLNEPGISKEKEHPYFKKGIPLPTIFGDDTLQAKWKTPEHIVIDRQLFQEANGFHYEYKNVSKVDIEKKGIAQAYRESIRFQHLFKISFENSPG